MSTPAQPIRARGPAEPGTIASLVPPAPAEADPLLARSAIGQLARVARDISHLARFSLQPAALGLAILFAALALYSPFVLPGPALVPIVSYDVVLAAASFATYHVCRRHTLTPFRLHALGAVLAVGVLGNISLGALLDANPLFSFCIAVLLIGSAGTTLSLAWAIAIAVIELAGWAAVALVIMPHHEFMQNVFVMGAAVAVAFVVHLSRQFAIARILELRDGDAVRERALQQALAAADEARAGLDRKVEERTAALRNELEERERLENQLRHAQKMEAVGRLAGGIAHDFNNLLTVIRMSLLTVGELTMPEDMRDAIRDASDSTDRAAGLTRDLLAFARKQQLQRASVAVNDILGGVERMVRRVAEASIRLEIRIAPDVGEVVADRHQIEQVLLNLAINACDAMDNRGTLAVRVESVDLAGADAARHRLRPGAYVRFAVSDTGTGMSEDTRRSVFEPFFTTKEVGRGTGLGLAVAHGIVTQHGGQIDVESELGKGSTFTVFLPHARSVPHPATTSAPRLTTMSLGHETVLVVEDEPAVRRAVQRNLERLGFRVLAAHDGEDALRITDSLDGVDLLLSDVVMPGIDGPELACRLRAKWPDLPVLFVTGYSADRLARTDAVGSHDRVLEKPYQLDELVRTIRGMLEARMRRAAASSA
jgi:signal transduction histidine kinase/ActR/RegA family two-component response regulator